MANPQQNRYCLCVTDFQSKIPPHHFVVILVSVFLVIIPNPSTASLSSTCSTTRFLRWTPTLESTSSPKSWDLTECFMTRPGLFLFQTIIFEKYLNSKAITNALLLTLLLKAIYAITKGITFSTFRNFNGILKPSLIKTGQE